MAKAGNERPPIIRRRKVVSGSGGHHGGAWKVAYADFVTAMMAFFLLMWLLNATTEKQRKGLADYFNPTIAVTRISGGGERMLAGDSIFAEDVLVHDGTGATARAQGKAQNPELAESTAGDAGETARFNALAERLMARGGESEIEAAFLRHVRVRITDEGLVVELADLEDAPLFAEESVMPLPVLGSLAALIAQVFAEVGNQIAVAGHVAARPVVLRVNPSWDLSFGRADAMRVLLQDAGLATQRFRRLTGAGERQPGMQPAMSRRNNRLEITLLRRPSPE